MKLVYLFCTMAYLLIPHSCPAKSGDYTGAPLIWKQLRLEDLIVDDRNIWIRYYGKASPGHVSFYSSCARETVDFYAEIASNGKQLLEKVYMLNKRKRLTLFGPKVVVSPFVIRSKYSRRITDIGTGQVLRATGTSLIVEKIEAVTYMYVCHNGKWRETLTSE